MTDFDDIYSILRNPYPTIWNSRAPYASFLKKHELLNKYHRVTRISYSTLESSCHNLPHDDLITTHLPSLLACSTHKKDVKKLALFSERVGDVCNDLVYQYDVLEESVLVKISSLFESLS